MRTQLLVLVLLVAAACVADAEKHRRRHRRLRTTSTTPAPGELAGELAGESAGERAGERVGEPAGEPPARPEDTEAEHIEMGMAERMDEKRYQESQQARVNVVSDREGENTDNEVFSDDPCLQVHCSAGRVCEIDELGDAVCNCIKECPYETNSRRKVCTNNNETWSSDCEVYRQRCLCLDGAPQCRGAAFQHVQVDYYGECREMPVCEESEMLDFPRRMRDWLANVMRDLAARRELSPHYAAMQREADVDLARRWTNAAIWKWCDLDAHDNDRFVSRHELFPIRAPLMSLEHCIAPFLDACDADSDHRLTLAEWGTCLQLDEFELEDRCDQFTNAVA